MYMYTYMCYIQRPGTNKFDSILCLLLLLLFYKPCICPLEPKRGEDPPLKAVTNTDTGLYYHSLSLVDVP